MEVQQFGTVLSRVNKLSHRMNVTVRDSERHPTQIFRILPKIDVHVVLQELKGFLALLALSICVKKARPFLAV